MSAVTTATRLRPVRALLREIRSPDWVLIAQGLRFAISGSLVAVVYLTVTTLLHDVFDVPFQVALVSGFLVGIALHFTLQRLFVWRHQQSFALPIHKQAGRYLIVCLPQYGITAITTSQLPGLLGLPVEGVYVVTALSLAVLNFIVFRGRVFHPEQVCDQLDERPPISISISPALDSCE
jgi:putative flippase GtrA